jgi:hypothetical protein
VHKSDGRAVSVVLHPTSFHTVFELVHAFKSSTMRGGKGGLGGGDGGRGDGGGLGGLGGGGE